MRPRNWILLLLVPPFIAVLYPPFYSGVNPTLGGVPYFIWYQFLWTIITSVLTIVVYLVHGRGDRAEDA
jgi:Protein of unknown function (DUF3311)